MKEVVSTTVTVVTLAAWVADRFRAERTLAWERERHRQELEAADMRRQADVAAALTDATTGLPTRRAWEPAAAECLRVPVDFALLDIDGFKQINDSYGHLVGDCILRLVASRMRDALGAEALIGRAGGDEIVTVAASGVAWEEVLAMVEAPVRLPGDGHAIPVRVSIGVVCTCGPADSTDLSQALSIADEAMYEAKKAGGGFRKVALSYSCQRDVESAAYVGLRS
ncbi:GGDEF domain-containing protein [Saccharopolyspora sp. ID03-671]|uniref:GGDEF domain-containing protein n=1 Tax=Saccharopolyspora sp. ID03-671 TaxID=3073066 RepID=UPI00324506CC